MNALSIVNKVISLVSFKMHKSRQKALTACVKNLLSGSAATVTSIGRDINNKAFEKHRIKRADRLLSNTNLLHETPCAGPSGPMLRCRVLWGWRLETSGYPIIALRCATEFLGGAVPALEE